MCDAGDPCSVNTAYVSESPFTVSPRSTTRPLNFWNCGSNSEFLRWQTSMNDAKWTFRLSFLASTIISFLFLTCQLPCRYSLAFLILSALLPLHLVFSLLEASENLPFGFSKIRQFRQYKRISSCVFQYCRGFSPLLFIGILLSIAAGIGISKFPQPLFIMSLNSSSSGSMK